MNTRDQVYESIGARYAAARRSDPRINQVIVDPLGGARTVINVGAGVGNYEPTDRILTAVEPSLEMITQRTTGAGTSVRGVAEALPFRDQTFDAALATFTFHHWSKVAAGLNEMRRVAKRQVILLLEPSESLKFCLAEYFPGMLGVALRDRRSGSG